MSVQIKPSVDDCHWYVRLPVPIAAFTTTNCAGSPPEQIVWSEETEPGVILLIFIVSGFDVTVQEIPFNKLVVINW